ncbi:MAG: winged helix-turn-helix domain-containing protein [Candidatus Nanohaloarchaea archaeon]|nr:winged helix-turn-helix domain-containing protein [Candidatus Nanohaloarchaea archaeon]
MDETVLFYLSEAGDKRLKMLQLVSEAEEEQEGMYLTKMAEEIGISHVAARKHLQLLLEEGYLRYKNPDGKPKFLEMTDKGRSVLEDG